MGNITLSAHVPDQKPREEISYQITGVELRKHCEARANFHKDRQAFYEKKAEEFSKQAEEVKQQPQAPSYVNTIGSGAISAFASVSTVIESNRESMERQKRTHEQQKVFFRFAAKHLRKQSYDLNDQECRRYELFY